MPTLSHIATVYPQFQITQDQMEVVGQSWLAGNVQAQETFSRINAQSGVQSRRFAFPQEKILSFNGLENRVACFEEKGTEMLIAAIEAALAQSKFLPSEIGSLVYTSCSIPSIPSIDAAAVLATGLNNTILRVPIYQHGCAGGVIGLALGSKLAQLGSPVLVASVELCSLVFQPKNHSGAHLVGGAIFADGAAATVIAPEAGFFTIIDTESQLLPDSRHLMGYDIFDDGFHLRLDRALPSALIEHAPAIINAFLARNSKQTSDIDYWLFHPGGIKILNFLRDTFALKQEQCTWSYDVLRDHGNLSSATILYVLQAFFNQITPEPGRTALVMGIGPGLTVELILLEA